jgi:hypothetical protein
MLLQRNAVGKAIPNILELVMKNTPIIGQRLLTSPLQAYLGDTAGSVPNHRNKASFNTIFFLFSQSI